jgi:hypothetical protein
MVLDRVKKKQKKTIDTDKVLVSFERWQGVSIRAYTSVAKKRGFTLTYAILSEYHG